jgi:hypothetical protein
MASALRKRSFGFFFSVRGDQCVHRRREGAVDRRGSHRLLLHVRGDLQSLVDGQSAVLLCVRVRVCVQYRAERPAPT